MIIQQGFSTKPLAKIGTYLMRILSVLILAMSSFLVLANQPFYFIAKQAPEASLTLGGNTNDVVYLRWDLVEGDLPEDIVQFNLYRDGVLIGEYPANEMLSEQAVAALYRGASQSRRLLETMTLLKEESVLDPNRLEVQVNDYAREILARAQSDEYWAQLASKRDFNIAMVRNRAAIDRPGQGAFSYELRAIDLQGQMRRVGFVGVNTNQSQRLLPIPDFSQLSLSQCDLPDIKDHYSVALNWSSAGTQNMADRVANQLFISGYDLYRSTDNIDASITSAPQRDLAQEAISLAYNNQGQVAFADLERVNKTLITVSPDLDLSNPEWLETHEDLEQAGIQPGDTRAYYLVARDFTGNFGPTTATLVTVGDMSRPPAPWDIDVYLAEETQRVELSFEKIDEESYLESFGESKRVCGVSESGAISFVGRDESCAEQRHKIIQTSVADYALYRFDNFADASRFKDSDGDGFSDRIERPNNTQCVAADTAGGALIEADIEEVEFSNHVRIVLKDEAPANNKGDIYWYRVAAKSSSGRLSFLTEPVRVNFPDRSLPESPLVTVSYPGDGSEICDCELDYQDNNDPWAFSVDAGLGNAVTLNCNGNSYPLNPKDLATSTALACNIPNLDINPIETDCAMGGQALTNAQGFNCSVDLPANSNFCNTGSMRIRAVSCGSVPAPVGVVTGPVTFTATPQDADECVSIYQDIAGESIKVSTSCGFDEPADEYVVEKGEFCGYAVSHDQNNNVSSSTRIECRDVVNPNDGTQLIAPRIDTLQLGTDFASLNIALPTQKQSIIEVEFLQRLPLISDKQIKRIGIASASEQQSTVSFDLPLLQGASDQWCARARIHGASERVDTGRVSAWSKERCDLRASSAQTIPQWLSWPGLQTAKRDDDLVAQSNTSLGAVAESSPLSEGIHIQLLDLENTCITRPNSVTFLGEVEQAPISQGPALVDINCSESSRNFKLAAYQSALNFMVFRQSRLNGQITDFKQVSPLIDYAHWASFVDLKNDERFRLRDPYIWASAADMGNTNEITLNYMDRVPLLEGREYRYQFVYFDAKHALVSWRQSNWVMYNNNQATQFFGGLNL